MSTEVATVLSYFCMATAFVWLTSYCKLFFFSVFFLVVFEETFPDCDGQFQCGAKDLLIILIGETYGKVLVKYSAWDGIP